MLNISRIERFAWFIRYNGFAPNTLLKRVQPREYWMIYRRSGCLADAWFGSSPTPLPISNLQRWHTRRLRKKYRFFMGEGEGVGEEPNHTTVRKPGKSLYTLWCSNAQGSGTKVEKSSNKKEPQIIIIRRCVCISWWKRVELCRSREGGGGGESLYYIYVYDRWASLLRRHNGPGEKPINKRHKDEQPLSSSSILCAPLQPY